MPLFTRQNIFNLEVKIIMLYPPIDELVEKVGNNYALTNLVSKRAKELEKTIPEVIDNSQEKAISLAAREVADGKIVGSTEDK